MEYYEVAAKWWADQLRDSPNVDSEELSLDDYKEACLLKQFQDENSNSYPEKLSIMEDILSELIHEEVKKEGELIISVDYKESSFLNTQSIFSSYMPCDLLQDALAKAGLSYTNLPLRRMMWVSPKEISVTSGRGNPRIRIFTCETD